MEVVAEVGLRQRKKQQTRELIADVARRLFAERGFDQVTVAEVARAANVSEVTVFNYFPAKEDLFYSGMLFFEESLINAVRNRQPGESVLEAFRRPIFEGFKRLAGDEATAAIIAARSIIHASPALEVRELEIVATYTRLLGDLIAAEAGLKPGDLEAMGVASALMGVQRALVEYVHAGVLAGRRGEKLASDARSQATRAFARLEKGLSEYGRKPRR